MATQSVEAVEANTKLSRLQAADVVVVTKTGCPYCKRAKVAMG
jgi:hypothetical protein